MNYIPITSNDQHDDTLHVGNSGVNTIQQHDASMQHFLLAKKDQDALLNLFAGYVVKKGYNFSDSTSEVKIRFLREEFLQDIQKTQKGFCEYMNTVLGRPLQIQDISFLVLETEALSKQHSTMLQFLQIAYIDKLKEILFHKKNGFNESQKSFFLKNVANPEFIGKLSMSVFLQNISNWRKDLGVSYTQGVLIDDALKNISVYDVMTSIKQHKFLGGDEIHTVSKNGNIDVGGVLEDVVSFFSKQYIENYQKFEESIIDIIEAEGKQYNTLGLYDDTVTSILKTCNGDLQACSDKDKKLVFDTMKSLWSKTNAYNITKNNLIDVLGFINDQQYDSIVDAIFDIEKRDIKIPLKDGKSVNISINKRVLPIGKQLLHNMDVVDGMPLQIEVMQFMNNKKIEKKSKLYNMTNPKTLSQLIHDIALYVGYVEQPLLKAKEGQESMMMSVVSNQLSKAIEAGEDVDDKKNMIGKIYNNDELSAIEDVFPLYGIEKKYYHNVPSFEYDAVVANSKLSDNSRVVKAIELLDNLRGKGRFISKTPQEQSAIKKAILDAHYSCVGQEGTVVGQVAEIYSYTKEQLREKGMILSRAGLQWEEIRLLFKAGISGTTNESINDELRREKASIANEKEQILSKYSKAKEVLDQIYNYGFEGKPSIKSLEQRKKYLKDALDIQRKVQEDAQKQQNNQKYWGSLSDMEKQSHIDRIQELKEEYQNILDQQDAIQQIIQEIEQIEQVKEAKKDFEVTGQEIVQVNKKLKEIDEKIAMYDIHGYSDNYFDRNNATPEQIETHYNTYSGLYEKEIEQLKLQKDELLIKQNNIVDSTSSFAEVVRKDLQKVDERIRAKRTQLESLEQKYQDATNKLYNKNKSNQNTDQENTEGFKKLQTVWGGLTGHTDLELGGTDAKIHSIYLRYDEKHIGDFGGSFVRCDIIKVDKNSGQITLKFYGVTGKLTQTAGSSQESIEGKEVTYSPDGFKEFLNQSIWEEKIRMPGSPSGGYTSMRQWGEQLKQDINDGKYSFDAKTEKWINNFVSKVDFASIKKQDPTGEKEPEKIVYMGRTQTEDAGNPDWVEQGDWYKIDFSREPMIRIIQPMYPGSKPIDMTYDAFLLFCADKGLNPYSQEDVDSINTKAGHQKGKDYIDQGVVPGTQDKSVLDKNSKKGLFGWNWITIHAAKTQWKNIIGAYKKKIESWTKEDEEKAAGLFANSWFAKKIAGAGIPLLSEVMMDNFVGPAASEGDRKKKEKIDKYAKEPEEYKDTTPGGAFDYINAVLFDNPDKARNNLLRVAGYFQYCCSKGELYPRVLAKYKDSGLWVKMLCGNTWQQAYLRWYEEQKQLSDQYPDDLDLRNRVRYGEAYFISNVIGNKNYEGASSETQYKNANGKSLTRGDVIGNEFASIYSKSWMGGILDVAVSGGMGAAEKIRSKKEDLMKSEKENFNSIYAEVYGNFESKSLTGGMGHLEPLAAKMRGNETYYQKRSLAMLYPILSGQLRFLTDTAIKGEYLGVSRKYNFPLGLYAWNAPENGRSELIKLLTMFEKNAGYVVSEENPSISTIVQTLGDKSDSESLKKFTGALKKWRGDTEDGGGMGPHVLKVMSSQFELQKIEKKLQRNVIGSSDTPINSQLAQDYTKTLRSYIDNKIGDSDQGDVAGDAKLDALSIKKNIWAMSPGFINGVMWKMRGKQFDPKVIDNVPGLWNELTKELKKYRDGDERIDARQVQFLMNKFHNLVQGRMRTGTEKDWLYALYSPKIIPFQPVAGKKGGGGLDTGEPYPAEMLKRYIIKGIDGRSIEGDNLPAVIRENLSVWIDIFQKKEFKEELAGLIKDGKIKMFADQKGLQSKINKEMLEKGKTLEEQAINYFKAPSKLGNRNRKQFQQEFGTGEYIPGDDDDDEEEYYNPYSFLTG